MSRNKVNHRNHVDLAERLREIREDFYGENGAQFLADALEIPLQTLLNYESGIVLPGHVVLKLIALTGVKPRWLLTGQGEKYNHNSQKAEPCAPTIILAENRGSNGWSISPSLDQVITELREHR